MYLHLFQNLILLLILLSLADTVYYLYYNENQILVDIYFPLIKVISFVSDIYVIPSSPKVIHFKNIINLKFLSLQILYFILTYANTKCGVHSSGILFLFSFLLVAFGAPQFRTQLLAKRDLVSFLRKRRYWFLCSLINIIVLLKIIILFIIEYKII